MTDTDDDLDDFDPPAADVAAGVDDDAGVAATHYADVYEFVHEFLVHIYARRVSRQNTRFRWCPQWYLHPEAVARLDALWKAFEHLRQDPTLGPATWWRDHTDPTMTALTAPDGPFTECGVDAHAVLPSLPIERPDWLTSREGPLRINADGRAARSPG
jgi:hypothetical protein